MSIDVRCLTGAEAHSALDDLARLRMTVFREWPYLYDGDLDYETAYLAPFADSRTAILVAAFDGAAIIGAATGSPMEDHQSEFAVPLAANNMAARDVFYCAESVLLAEYRGQGIGHLFFDFREDHARALGRKWSVFCSVRRSEAHSARPAEYRSLDKFWHKRGYAPLEGAFATYSWKDLDQDHETSKPLQIWRRALHGAQ